MQRALKHRQDSGRGLYALVACLADYASWPRLHGVGRHVHHEFERVFVLVAEHLEISAEEYIMSSSLVCTASASAFAPVNTFARHITAKLLTWPPFSRSSLALCSPWARLLTRLRGSLACLKVSHAAFMYTLH